MVDRNVAEGRGGKTAFSDPARRITYGELADSVARVGPMLAKLGLQREDRLAMIMLDTVDFPVLFWGAIRAGHHSDPAQHAAAGRAVPLHLADSRAKALFVSAPFLKIAESAGAGISTLKKLIVVGDAERAASGFCRVAERRKPRACRRDLRRRSRVLALFVRLDRHAERRAACAFEPDGDRDELRAAGARHHRERRVFLGRQALSRLWARQRHELSDVGRRDDRAAAGPPGAGRDLRGAAARAADAVLRRADALRHDAGRSRLHARERIEASALVRLRRRSAARACRNGMEEALRRRHPRRPRLDRDAAHLRLEPGRQAALRNVRHRGAGL